MEKTNFTPKEQERREPAFVETNEGREFLDEKVRESKESRPVKLSDQGMAKDAQELIGKMEEVSKHDEELKSESLEKGKALTHAEALDEINKIIGSGQGDGDEMTKFLEDNMK